MDRFAEEEEEDYNNDEEEEEEEMVMEDELRTKFVFDVTPLEIIDNEDDEDFFIINNAAAAAAAVNLVIRVIDHHFIYQYWSLKSGDSEQQQQQQLNSSSSCHHQHHHDYHHLRDDYDDDKEMIMIICQPTCPPEVAGKLVVDIGGGHQNVVLNDVDVLYECGRISTYQELEELKTCITQRISEAEPAVLLMAKPKTVRILVDLSTILKRYYANSATANSAAAQIAIELSDFALLIDDHYPAPQDMTMTLKPASRLSRDTLETKIFDKKDLTSSSSCPVCLNEFHVGVDEVKKMPCSHVFHWTCLMEWLVKRNTCPLCRYELPTFWERFQH